ncbi:helix-turn-helix domain-containing protein [Haloarchaeobius sp. DFWS5]|uniref:helix-turn-helix domain-containing protein n=1 Tax=Haloarchaeobius sp. DFWS5 TaxID=3446114 RepID=UPI003EC018CC
MTIVTEFSLSPDQLVLGDTVAALPAARIRIDHIAARDDGHRNVAVWVSEVDSTTFAETMDDDPTVTDVQRLGVSDDAALFQYVTTAEAQVRLHPVWVRLRGQLLDGSYARGWWTFRLRFPERKALVVTRNCLQNTETRFRIHWVRDGPRDEPLPTETLTDGQHEALTIALNLGYFDIPRRANLQDVGETLGISGQAVSERIRRGVGQLLDEHLDDY